MTTIPVVTPKAIDEQINAGEQVLLLDTRTEENRLAFPLETRKPLSQVHLPYRKMVAALRFGSITLPPPERAGRIVAFFDRGHTSAEAASVLCAAGRDGGYVVGVVAAGVLADLFGVPVAVAVIGAVTFVSGMVATTMRETRVRGEPAGVTPANDPARAAAPR